MATGTLRLFKSTCALRAGTRGLLADNGLRLPILLSRDRLTGVKEERSSRASFVMMTQATNSGNLDDDAFLGRLDFSGFWRIVVECEMTAGIVIGKEHIQNTTQRRYVDHDDVIETFAPYGADQPLNIGRLPRRSGSGENFGDLQVRDLLPKGVAIDPVTVVKNVARSSVPRKCLSYLHGSPLGSGGARSH